MLEPCRIAFHNMAPPFGAEELARDNVIELERLVGYSIVCGVAVEKRHRLNSRGNLFHISIELMVSGRRIVVHRDPPEGHMHEGLHTAIAEAFRMARRQLPDRGFGSGYVTASLTALRGAESEAVAAR